MAPDDTLLLESGDLSIRPELGEVSNVRGESARLGPINMKVLTLLLRRPGQVVSRNEIFETVWPNQVISDDALTRCVSDIRAELGKLSDGDRHIETIPKRGYRWVAEVRETSAPAPPAESPDERRTPIVDRPSGFFLRRSLLRWAGRGLMYLVALALIASLGVWLMSRFAQPGPPIVAVLPTRAGPDQADFAASVEQQIYDYLVREKQVELLSTSAVESRPINPFPYFYYEFGARWLLESELGNLSGEIALTVVLVDARTGIVLSRATSPIPHDDRAAAATVERLLRPLEDFARSQ